MNTFPLSEPLVQRLAWTLLHFVWQGFAIALLLALAILLGQVRRSEWRYCLSFVALVAITASPMVTFVLVNASVSIEQPVLNPPPPRPQPTIPHSIPDHHKVLPRFGIPAINVDPVSVIAPTATTSASVPSIDSQPDVSRLTFYSNRVTWQRAQPWIVRFWVCGVVLFSGRLLLSGVGVCQIRHRGISAPSWLVEQMQRLAGELQMACPELKVSHRVQEAIALGFLRPMILLPAVWVTQMPPDMLEAVLAHELAHIRRHDLWINLFQRIIETLLFYHPAVWWLSRRLRIERELCCDELVIRVTQNPLRYAETLEHIGRLSLATRSAPLIVSIMGSRSMLAVRIRNILRLQPPQQSSWVWLAGVIPLLVAGAVYWSMTTVSKVSAQAEVAQSDESIVSVKISGNKFHPEADLAKLVTTRPGTDVTPKQIKDDVDALIRTRWFSHVEPIIHNTDEGLVLTLQVTERPLINSVEYRGNTKISNETLSKLTQLTPGQPYDVSVNRECVRRIQEMYKEKGFAFVTVELARGDRQDDPDRDVVFQIDEGPKVKVSKVEFEDLGSRDAVSPEDQKRKKTTILWLDGGKYSGHDDSEWLLNYYHSLGYFDVEITPQYEHTTDKSKAELKYRIDEGIRYRINEISISGNEAFAQDQIKALIKVQPGQEYNQRQINKDVEAILARYGAIGRLFAQVRPIRKFPEKPGVVDLIYQISEDKVYRIRDVPLTEGNASTTPSNESEGTDGGVDKAQASTRRLTVAPIDREGAFNVRSVTKGRPYRQRTEISGGVLISIDETKHRWQMRANDAVVETDSDDRPVTGSQDTRMQLRASDSVLATETPLRMTLIGNVSVTCTSDDSRTLTRVTADKIMIDFERGLLLGEKALLLTSNGTTLKCDRIAITFRGDSFNVRRASEDIAVYLSSQAAKDAADKMDEIRSDRMRSNDREAAKNMVGRWLLTLPSQDLLDVQFSVSDDGSLRLACSKESDLIGRYSLNAGQLELVDHRSQEIDLVWRLEGRNRLKLITERRTGGVAQLGSKLERIAADAPKATIFQIPSDVLAQARELAAASLKEKGSSKSRRPVGLEDLESPEAIKRAVDRAMLLLGDHEKHEVGLIQLRYLGDEAFEALVAGLKSENPQVAKWSCSALEHRGLKAVGPLSEALKSNPDSAVRSTAASALGQTFQPTVIPALIAALDDPDPQVRNSVLHSIKYPRDARAIEPLKRFVDDPGAGHVASDAIRHIQTPQGYAWWPANKLDLCQLCWDAHTLKGERYRDVELNQLIAGVKSDDGTIGYCCLFALARLRSKDSAAAIIQAPLSEMKFQALAEIATPEAIDYLIQRLHSLNPQTRELAITGLANGADRWATPLLIALLDDPTLKVDARKMEFGGRPSIDTWPESHNAHSALYSLFSRFGLTGEWRNLYANQTNNVPEEIASVKVWWKQHGADFVAGRKVPTPNLTTVFYNDP